MGATVTALDISPAMLGQAREKAERDGLTISFDEGDVQSLRYGDASFDVVASCFGLVFAPDREAVARELARVCVQGGRLGLTAWRARPAQQELYERFRTGLGPAAEHTDWAAAGFAESLLGHAFELEIRSGVWLLEGDSPEALYAWMAESAPPTKRYLEQLPVERHEAFRAAMVEYWAQFTDADDRVAEPREYVLILGRRR